MNKEPGFRKRLLLELFKVSGKTGQRYMNYVPSFGNVRFAAMLPVFIVVAIVMYLLYIQTCPLKIF